ncbi:MAG TPA: glycosyltransferase family 39 protein [Blastocatellia bacterium]|nr:glycosyltransferase family 39 protein [Blastocatellia bacterium]
MMALVLPSYLTGIAVFGIGVILSLYSLFRLFAGEFRKRSEESTQSSAGTERDESKDSLYPMPITNRSGWVAAGLIGIIFIAGLLLRLQGLEARSMSHPEVYVPGIELPENMSEPPPRLSPARVVWWHFHNEPHPQAYYFLMWTWTKLFGTSLTAIRLPSVLFGTLSLILVFFVASRVYGQMAGILCMAMLAFNGHHIYWSQMARMYAMLCFLGLLSTLLLLKLVYDAKAHPVTEVPYVAVSFLGVWTEIYFWPFLAAQILWAVALMKAGHGRGSRIISLQSLVVILGAPLWAHAIYLSRSSPLGGPSLSFLREYMAFGFLFERDVFSQPHRQLPEVLASLAALLAVVLIVKAAGGGAGLSFWLLPQEPLNARRLLPIAAGSVVIILAMSLLAWRRHFIMMLTGCIPMLALGMPSVLCRIISMPKAAFLCRANIFAGPRSLMFLLAFLPALIVFALSFIFPLLASRLFLLFTPFLLILIAGGVSRYSPKLGHAVSVCVVILALHVTSAAYFRLTPSDSRDYQELAQKVKGAIEQQDLIFVHRASWRTTPIFYYLRKGEYRLIADGFQSAVENNPQSRVWLILLDEKQPTEQMRSALTGFTLEQTITARGGKGLLFVRDGQADGYDGQALGFGALR